MPARPGLHDLSTTAEVAVLRYRADLLDDFFENGAIALHWIAADGTILRANRAILEMLGYTADEYIGHNVREFHENREVMEGILSRLHRGEELHNLDARLRCKGGSFKHVLISSNVYREKGKFVHTRCFIRDITDRAKEEKRLREQVTAAQTILNQIAEALITLDERGYILSVNRAASKMLGLKWETKKFPRYDAVRNIFQLTTVGGKPVPRHLWSAERMLQGERRVDFEARLTRRDTRQSWICSFNAIPLFAPNGDVARVAILIRDMTDRKRDEEALQKADDKLRSYAATLEKTVQERTAKLEETIQFLDTFSYSIAHDLRAPVRAMQGFSLALLEDYGAVLDETGKDYAQRIFASAKRMDSLITDLLEYGRLSRNTFELTPVDLNQEVKKILPLFSEQTSRAEIQVAPLPKVLAHPTVIQQILSNLISNALKFIKPQTNARVLIRAERKRSKVRLWVEDNGIGVPKEFQERIFLLFERLNGGEYPGSGIGLAIVQKAVERLRGTVGIESKPGCGSRFWVELRSVAGTGRDQRKVLKTGVKSAGTIFA